MSYPFSSPSDKAKRVRQTSNFSLLLGRRIYRALSQRYSARAQSLDELRERFRLSSWMHQKFKW